MVPQLSRPAFRRPNLIGDGYAARTLRTGLPGAGGGGPGDFLRAAGELAARSGLGGAGGLVRRGSSGLVRRGSRSGRRGDLARKSRIVVFQGLSGSAGGYVARAMSHGLGQGFENAREAAQRRLIANLTDAARFELAAGGDRGAQAGAGARSAGLGERAGAGREGGLPPFAPSPVSTSLAFAKPDVRGIEQAPSGLSACPSMAGREGRKLSPPRMGSGVRAASGARTDSVERRGSAARLTGRGRGFASADGRGETGTDRVGVHRRSVLPEVERIRTGYAGGHGRVNGG
jgi:hypothetical protein